MEKEIKKLIKTSCSNYVDGQCALFGRECPLIDGGTYRGKKIPVTDNSCSYFELYVLPADKALEAEYHGKETLSKKCKGCGKGFNSVANRAVYCGDNCRKSARRSTYVKANQKRTK
ncbi:hypothetical protein LIT32_18020 [Bacillus sp. CMF21]|nr:hypothetical protein LIT32_18020 [Bacillus sp. CMF21]